jgi:pimeloyl-ACP methyl ester carboxylesterase
VADQAAAFIDLVDSLRLKQVDIFGYQGGSLAAIEFALARPGQVRRVLLLGVPASDGGYQVGERLPLLRQPVTILRAHDEFWDSTARAEALLREARRIDLTTANAQVFESGSAEIVQITREFLDR